MPDYLEVGRDEQGWANDYLVRAPDDEGPEWPIVGSPAHLDVAGAPR